MNSGDKVGEKAMPMVQVDPERVRAEDPAKGSWYVPDTKKGTV